MAGANEVRMREAVSDISVSAATASVRADAALASARPERWRRSPTVPRPPRRAAPSGRSPARRRADRCGRAGPRGSRRRGWPSVASNRWVSSGPTSRAIRRAVDPEGGRRQLRGGHRRDPVDQLVRLVDHQQRMFGQHRRFGDGVDGQQRVVGDHDVGGAGAAARPFGKALGAKRAAGHPEAFARRDADLRPRPIWDTGLQIVAVAGLGRRRPGGEPLHVAAQCAGRHRVEELLLRPTVRSSPSAAPPL